MEGEGADDNDKVEFDRIADQINNPDKYKPAKTRKKSLSPRYKANNEGGFANPPVKGQFKKGNPGGPGRPKGVTNLESALRKVFRSKVAVTRNGKRELLYVAEATAERVTKEMLTGPLRALETGMRLQEKYGPAEPQPEQLFDYSEFTSEEVREFKRLINKAQGLPTEAYEPPPIRYYSDSWPDGIVYRHVHDISDNTPPEIERIRHYAYWSAARPMNLPDPNKG